MTLILSGTDGLSDVDGSAATPAIRGTDTNTGIFFPAADTIAFSEGGVESMRIDSSGNLAFTGTSQRITGDFSNATIANRVAFQTSTTNGNTVVGAIPNGTGTTAALQVNNNGDLTAALAFGNLQASSTEVALQAGIRNAGSYLPMTFYTGGSERMRLATGGQVLVGASSGDTYNLLQVQTMLGFATTSGYYSEINNNLYYGSASWRNKNAGPASQISLDGGASNQASIRFNVSADATSTPANSAIGLFEAMRITNAGNVGIGTSSPNLSSSSTALTVNTGTAGNYSALEFASGGTLNYHINTNNSAIYHVAAGTRPWIVYTNGTERMRIDSSGNLLVGTTTFASGQNGVLLRGTNSGGTDEVLQVRTSGTGSKFNTAFYNDNGRIGSINTSGSSTSYVTSSDYRLKHDIQPMIGALAKVAALKPVTYKWKVDGSDGEGFIAHELQEVCPSAVTGEKDAVDAEGNPVYQGIDTSFLVATLTAAIQEQQAIIQSLTARIEALEGK